MIKSTEIASERLSSLLLTSFSFLRPVFLLPSHVYIVSYIQPSLISIYTCHKYFYIAVSVAKPPAVILMTARTYQSSIL
jgi:hypothetical protein